MSSILDTLAVTQQELGSTRCEHPKGWLQIECQHGTRVWKPLRCRHCEGCIRAKAALQIARLIIALAPANSISFLTLTSLPDTDWKLIMKAWSSFVRWLRTRAPSAQYAAVKEEGPNTGMKHLHVLLIDVPFVPWEDASDAWKRVTGAWNVSLQRVDGAKAIRYVTKHAWKAFIPGTKNITFSAHFPKLAHSCPLEVSITKAGPPIDRQWLAILRDGTRVELYTPGCNCWPEIAKEVKSQWTPALPRSNVPSASLTFPT